jgi:hypothetical protein
MLSYFLVKKQLLARIIEFFQEYIFFFEKC